MYENKLEMHNSDFHSKDENSTLQFLKTSFFDSCSENIKSRLFGRCEDDISKQKINEKCFMEKLSNKTGELKLCMFYLCEDSIYYESKVC